MPRICQFILLTLSLITPLAAADQSIDETSATLAVEQVEPIPLFSATNEQIRFVVRTQLQCDSASDENALRIMVADTRLSTALDTLESVRNIEMEVPLAQLTGLAEAMLCERSSDEDNPGILYLPGAFSAQVSAQCGNVVQHTSVPLAVNLDCAQPAPDASPEN